MNKEVMEIIDYYRQFGEVSKIEYRGKMRYYPEDCSQDKIFELRTQLPHEYMPSWVFIIDFNGKKYRLVLAKNTDGEFITFPGKSFCDYMSHNKSYADNTYWAKQNLFRAEEFNHFTPHPTCRIIK